MIPEITNNGPCFRIEPYLNSCACISCCTKRNVEAIRAWIERDRREQEKQKQLVN